MTKQKVEQTTTTVANIEKSNNQHITDVQVAHKLGGLGPKWDKSGHIWGQSAPIWGQP